MSSLSTCSMTPENLSSLSRYFLSLVAVHTILSDLLPPSSYFRFNPYLSDDFLLDEIAEERWDLMKQDVEMYCRKNWTKLVTAANHLQQQKMIHQKASEWIKDQVERLG